MAFKREKTMTVALWRREIVAASKERFVHSAEIR